MARKNFNYVKEIQVQDNLITNFEDIKKAATTHFHDLYTAQPNLEDVDLLRLVPRKVKNKDNELLLKTITLEEIKKAVEAMEDDRAPGPDGYNVNFIKICWDIVKHELFKMISKSQRCSRLGGSTNSVFLALIPKEKDAKSFDRFRPISLCNIGYKIITKIMASRLKTSFLIWFRRTKEDSLKVERFGIMSS